MPRYDYDCAACGTRFEVVQGVHADPPVECPACGGGPIKKAFAPPTIHFKGSGWAKKERRSAAGSSARKAGGPDSSDPASSDDGATTRSSPETEGGGAAASAASGTPASTTAKSGSGTSTQASD